MKIFSDYLKASIQGTDKLFPSLTEQVLMDTKQVSIRLIPLVEQLLYACQGGKKIRATMAKLGYELTGNTYNEDIAMAGLAFDIFHSSILIHDDIIDESPTRRGKDTVHVALGNNHYGISQAICLGDIGFFVANRILCQTHFADNLKVNAINLFSNTIITTALGEMLDVMSPILTDKTEEDLLSILKNKTAYYTICDPMRLGAILGGGNEILLKNIFDFGEDLGIALQIKDDINGVFASSEETGKPNYTDIEEGKLTYLSLYAFKNSNAEQREFLSVNYGKKAVTNDVLEKIRKIFIDTGALDFAYNKIDDYINSAKKKTILFSEEYTPLLISLCDYVYSYK